MEKHTVKLPGQSPQTHVQLSLTPKQAEIAESLRRRHRHNSVEENIPFVLEMVDDRLDSGYWKYLAMAAMVTKLRGSLKWDRDQCLEPKNMEKFSDDIFELCAVKAEKSNRELFDKWAAIWDDETAVHSFGHDRHWAYFAIMSLGDEAIPWILERYRDDIHIKWHIVLTRATGFNPAQEKNEERLSGLVGYDVRGIQQDWMEWAYLHGLLSRTTADEKM